MLVGLGGRDYCCFVGGLNASGCLGLCLFRCVVFSVLRWMCCCVVWIWLFLLLVLLTVDGLILFTRGAWFVASCCFNYVVV